MSDSPRPSIVQPPASEKLGWGLAHIFLTAISLPLLGGFYVEFVWGEVPCSLCLLQRMCMILAGLGMVWILSGRADLDREAQLTEWSRGFAVSLLAATLGLSISLRQIFIHIAPDDPGFGSAVFGYHLYSWAFGIFVVVLICSGLCLLFCQLLAPGPRPSKWPPLTRAIVGLFAALIVANAMIAGYHTIVKLSATLEPT